MLRDRIRKGVRRIGRGIVRRVLGAEADEVAVSASVSRPAARNPAPPVSPFAAPAPAPAPASVAPAPAPAAESASSDEVGPPLTRAMVEVLFADMVRPALQADGGDIDLIKVEDNDVYVRLLGSCRSCPSSTITMKMGIERLLTEEFPQFRHLVQVDAAPGVEVG